MDDPTRLQPVDTYAPSPTALAYPLESASVNAHPQAVLAPMGSSMHSTRPIAQGSEFDQPLPTGLKLHPSSSWAPFPHPSHGIAYAHHPPPLPSHLHQYPPYAVNSYDAHAGVASASASVTHGYAPAFAPVLQRVRDSLAAAYPHHAPQSQSQSQHEYGLVPGPSSSAISGPAPRYINRTGTWYDPSSDPRGRVPTSKIKRSKRKHQHESLGAAVFAPPTYPVPPLPLPPTTSSSSSATREHKHGHEHDAGRGSESLNHALTRRASAAYDIAASGQLAYGAGGADAGTSLGSPVCLTCESGSGLGPRMSQTSSTPRLRAEAEVFRPSRSPAASLASTPVLEQYWVNVHPSATEVEQEGRAPPVMTPWTEGRVDGGGEMGHGDTASPCQGGSQGEERDSVELGSDDTTWAFAVPDADAPPMASVEDVHDRPRASRDGEEDENEIEPHARPAMPRNTSENAIRTYRDAEQTLCAAQSTGSLASMVAGHVPLASPLARQQPHEDEHADAASFASESEVGQMLMLEPGVALDAPAGAGTRAGHGGRKGFQPDIDIGGVSRFAPDGADPFGSVGIGMWSEDDDGVGAEYDPALPLSLYHAGGHVPPPYGQSYIVPLDRHTAHDVEAVWRHVRGPGLGLGLGAPLTPMSGVGAFTPGGGGHERIAELASGDEDEGGEGRVPGLNVDMGSSSDFGSGSEAEADEKADPIRAAARAAALARDGGGGSGGSGGGRRGTSQDGVTPVFAQQMDAGKKRKARPSKKSSKAEITGSGGIKGQSQNTSRGGSKSKRRLKLKPESGVGAGAAASLGSAVVGGAGQGGVEVQGEGCRGRSRATAGAVGVCGLEVDVELEVARGGTTEHDSLDVDVEDGYVHLLGFGGSDLDLDGDSDGSESEPDIPLSQTRTTKRPPGGKRATAMLAQAPALDGAGSIKHKQHASGHDNANTYWRHDLSSFPVPVANAEAAAAVDVQAGLSVQIHPARAHGGLYSMPTPALSPRRAFEYSDTEVDEHSLVGDKEQGTKQGADADGCGGYWFGLETGRMGNGNGNALQLDLSNDYDTYHTGLDLTYTRARDGDRARTEVIEDHSGEGEGDRPSSAYAVPHSQRAASRVPPFSAQAKEVGDEEGEGEGEDELDVQASETVSLSDSDLEDEDDGDDSGSYVPSPRMRVSRVSTLAAGRPRSHTGIKGTNTKRIRSDSEFSYLPSPPAPLSLLPLGIAGAAAGRRTASAGDADASRAALGQVADGSAAGARGSKGVGGVHRQRAVGERRKPIADPEIRARTESLRQRLIQGEGAALAGVVAGGGSGGRGRKFDEKLCMLMVDERFSDVIRWNEDGGAMLIDDFPSFWLVAARFVMRSDTQISAFDKQLSNHGFSRQTEAGHTRKTIVHPYVTANDDALWAAVSARPRLIEYGKVDVELYPRIRRRGQTAHVQPASAGGSAPHGGEDESFSLSSSSRAQKHTTKKGRKSARARAVKRVKHEDEGDVKPGSETGRGVGVGVGVGVGAGEGEGEAKWMEREREREHEDLRQEVQRVVEMNEAMSARMDRLVRALRTVRRSVPAFGRGEFMIKLGLSEEDLHLDLAHAASAKDKLSDGQRIDETKAEPTIGSGARLDVDMPSSWSLATLVNPDLADSDAETQSETQSEAEAGAEGKGKSKGKGKPSSCSNADTTAAAAAAAVAVAVLVRGRGAGAQRQEAGDGASRTVSKKRSRIEAGFVADGREGVAAAAAAAAAGGAAGGEGDDEKEVQELEQGDEATLIPVTESKRKMRSGASEALAGAGVGAGPGADARGTRAQAQTQAQAKAKVKGRSKVRRSK